MAARAGQMEVVRCLLRNGALVDAMARVSYFQFPSFFINTVNEPILPTGMHTHMGDVTCLNSDCHVRFLLFPQSQPPHSGLCFSLISI